MHDEQRKLKQLEAAIRLRALQREKSDMAQARARRALNEAQHAFDDEKAGYQSILALHAEQKRTGAALDPFLYEQRLLMQMAAHSGLEKKLADVSAAKAEYQTTVAAALASKVKEDVVRKAHGQTEASWQAHLYSQESIDVFDAQQSREDHHGL
jgi:hypothetical protein